jgi:Fe-S cluster biogenesis protein NfuA
MALPPDSGDWQARVARVLATEIRPALQMDGIDLEILDVHDGIVRVRLHGSCTGCPSAIMAVIMEIEQELQKRIPEVAYLEVVP